MMTGRGWPALVASMALPLGGLRAQPPGPPPAASDRDKAISCLTAAIAHEAGFEPVEGQQAVAEVVLNRVLHPAYPKTVCGVVFHGSARRTGCQFTFTCDGAMRRVLPPRLAGAARSVAVAALDGLNPARVAGATHYHADYVSPYWAPSLIRVRKIGAHIFYRPPGLRDQTPGAARFAPSNEPEIAALGQIAQTPTRPMPTPPASFAPWGLVVAIPGQGMRP